MHLIDQYLNQPIRNKFLFFLMSSIALIGITIFSALLFIYRDFSSQTVTMTSKTLDLYTRQLDDSLSQLADYSLGLVFDPSVQDNLKNLASTVDSYEILMTRAALDEKLFLSASSMEYIHHADIITPENLFLSSASERIAKPLQNFEDLDHITSQGGRCVWDISSAKESKGQLVMSRLIQTIGNDFVYEPLGILSFYIDMNALTDMKDFSENYFQSCFFITASSGDILYRSGNAENLDSITAVGASIYQEFNNTAYFVTTQPSAVAGWNYCLLLPKSEILGRIVTITVSLVLIFILLIFLCILVSCHLSHRITLPLFYLSREMDSVASGNFQIKEDHLLSYTANDELRAICLHFIQMTSQLDTLITENYTVKLLNKDAQLRALQAQIDPHFLYNTLDCVNWLAKLAGQKDISTIVQSLAALMRQTMSTGKEGYRLQDELNLLENYLAIQQIRYGGRLLFSRSIEEEMLKLPFPKLILQPLIENSIKYGLENMDGVCEIFLEVLPEGSKCCRICISDNGPGISPEAVPYILSGEIKPRGSGVGLKNVSDRLKLLYCMEEPLQITYSDPGGTCITMRIPFEL